MKSPRYFWRSAVDVHLPLRLDIYEAVSELLHIRLYEGEELREHVLPHVIWPWYEP